MEFGFGSGVLTGVRTDVSNTSPVRFGALQDVTVEFAGEIKELFATTQFPIDVARGKTKITGKAKVAEIRAIMFNELFFGQTLATGQLKYAYNEAGTIGTAAASYTVAFSGSTPLIDEGVFYVTGGAQLLAVSSGPTTGQYSFATATGIYTFASSEIGTAVDVNYTYHVSTGSNIAIGSPLMGNTPTFKATLFQQFEGAQILLVLNKCVSSRLTFPTRIDDYVIEELDFSAFADSSGNVGSWNSAT